MSKRTSMNLFEIMDAFDQLVERIEKVENRPHEPQNYKDKCDEMEKRINTLERKIKFKKMYSR